MGKHQIDDRDRQILIEAIEQAERGKRVARVELAKTMGRWDEGDADMQALADDLRRLAAMKNDLEYELKHAPSASAPAC